MNRIRQALTRTDRDETGAISAEFVAVLIIVAALIAAIWAVNLPSTVKSCVEDASGRLFDGGASTEMECETGGTTDGEEDDD